MLLKTKNESEGLSYGLYCKGLSSGLERGPYKEDLRKRTLERGPYKEDLIKRVT
jgi:hypothetical protein